jgi:hypothetical protein
VGSLPRSLARGPKKSGNDWYAMGRRVGKVYRSWRGTSASTIRAGIRILDLRLYTTMSLFKLIMIVKTRCTINPRVKPDTYLRPLHVV